MCHHSDWSVMILLMFHSDWSPYDSIHGFIRNGLLMIHSIDTKKMRKEMMIHSARFILLLPTPASFTIHSDQHFELEPESF